MTLACCCYRYRHCDLGAVSYRYELALYDTGPVLCRALDILEIPGVCLALAKHRTCASSRGGGQSAERKRFTPHPQPLDNQGRRGATGSQLSICP